jgi:hypothetical protein
MEPVVFILIFLRKRGRGPRSIYGAKRIIWVQHNMARARLQNVIAKRIYGFCPFNKIDALQFYIRQP